MGIVEHIDLTGVFPLLEHPEPARDPDFLRSELAGWANYSSAEEEPEVVNKLLGEQVALGHCMALSPLRKSEHSWVASTTDLRAQHQHPRRLSRERSESAADACCIVACVSRSS